MTNIEQIKARFWELLPGSLDDYSQALDKLLDLVGELSVERLVRFVNNMNDYDTQLLAVADDGDECPDPLYGPKDFGEDVETEINANERNV